MSFYDANLQETNKSFSPRNLDPIQLDDSFYGLEFANCNTAGESGFDSCSNLNVNDNNALDFRFGAQSVWTLIWEGSRILDHVIYINFAPECRSHGLVYCDMNPENFLFKSCKDDSLLKGYRFWSIKLSQFRFFTILD
ncbi:hypothetical protein L1987_43578 [Smallanthus sonchifolius]|uniref:Uncharacterized protein n=1 Tax=Smallanthus sonchifolius TaxID=185202 RepID=A0ACB9GLH4_9ASTR|nr:hypothetical protein L1987_43578 [Smallanthus sonchifolius]